MHKFTEFIEIPSNVTEAFEEQSEINAETAKMKIDKSQMRNIKSEIPRKNIIIDAKDK